jgi:hypothetical protein
MIQTQSQNEEIRQIYVFITSEKSFRTFFVKNDWDDFSYKVWVKVWDDFSCKVLVKVWYKVGSKVGNKVRRKLFS